MSILPKAIYRVSAVTISLIKIVSVCLVTQSCPTPLDYSPPGSSVLGISQARTLEWVAISFSRVSFQLRDQTHIFCVSCVAGRFFTHWAISEATDCSLLILSCLFTWLMLKILFIIAFFMKNWVCIYFSIIWLFELESFFFIVNWQNFSFSFSLKLNDFCLSLSSFFKNIFLLMVFFLYAWKFVNVSLSSV